MPIVFVHQLLGCFIVYAYTKCMVPSAFRCIPNCKKLVPWWSNCLFHCATKAVFCTKTAIRDKIIIYYFILFFSLLFFACNRVGDIYCLTWSVSWVWFGWKSTCSSPITVGIYNDSFLNSKETWIKKKLLERNWASIPLGGGPRDQDSLYNLMNSILGKLPQNKPL